MRTDAQFLRVMCVHIGNSLDRARILAISDALEGVLTPNPDRYPKVYQAIKINQAARIKVDDSWITRSELEALRLYMQGLEPREIAQQLHKSPKTIHAQLVSSRGRLQCANYAQLALKLREVLESLNRIEEPGRSTNAQQPPDRSKVARGAPSRAL